MPPTIRSEQVGGQTYSIFIKEPVNMGSSEASRAEGDLKSLPPPLVNTTHCREPSVSSFW